MYNLTIKLISRLRERELKLQTDLMTASREVNRLRGDKKHAGKTDKCGEWYCDNNT